MQILLNGLFSSSIIALLAVSFQLVYLPSRVFYLGLAGIFSISPYFVYQFQAYGIEKFSSVVLSIIIAGLLSALIGYFNHLPLIKKGYLRNYSEQRISISHLLSSLGIFLILIQIIEIVWGTKSKSLQLIDGRDFEFFGLFFSKNDVVSFFVSFSFIIAILLLLYKTDLGIKLRALSNNPTQFLLRGYQDKNFYLFSFGVCGMLTGISSILYADQLGFDSFQGFYILLLAIVSVIIGGRNSFIGPVLGAIILGISQSVSAAFISSSWKDGIVFLLLIIILFIKPSGLIRTKGRIEINL
jgi:branched-chain amino acid transport system permease protein